MATQEKETPINVRETKQISFFIAQVVNLDNKKILSTFTAMI
jgi:hypothetical protein